MEIDAKKLHELHVAHVRFIAPDERFYEVMDALDYALSTYGRLYHRDAKGRWHKVPVRFVKTECYEVTYYNGHRIVPIRQLLAEVFFPDIEWIYLYNPNFCVLNAYRWKIEDLYALTDRDDLVEVLQAKMDHRCPALSDEKLGNKFINRFEVDRPINSYTLQTYNNMRSRATNSNVKREHPLYADATVSNEWFDDPDKFRQYLLDHQYYHPDKLTIDKDILNYGKEKCYRDGTVAYVPVYINNIFTEHKGKLGYSIQIIKYSDGSTKFKLPGIAFAMKGKKNPDLYFDNYSEALTAGRKRRADYIRDVVLHERELGCMPEYITDAMLRWADHCEIGLIKMWEPDPDVLQEMGVI